MQLYISAISFFFLTLDHDPEYFLKPMNFDLERFNEMNEE